MHYGYYKDKDGNLVVSASMRNTSEEMVKYLQRRIDNGDIPADVIKAGKIKNVFSGKAVLHPADEYDAKIGRDIARSRAMEKKSDSQYKAAVRIATTYFKKVAKFNQEFNRMMKAFGFEGCDFMSMVDFDKLVMSADMGNPTESPELNLLFNMHSAYQNLDDTYMIGDLFSAYGDDFENLSDGEDEEDMFFDGNCSLESLANEKAD